MGICRWNLFAERFRASAVDLSVRGLLRGGSIWSAPCRRRYRTHLHPHLPKYRDDHFHPSDYRRSPSADQL